MAEFDIDTIVIGAGAVGLAIGRRLTAGGRETMVLERGPAVGMETSARNSEVIHAGLYYPPRSLKAKACTAGRDRLYAYCAEHAVPHRRCGKLMVATSSGQLSKLQAIWDNATANGVPGLRWLTLAEVAELEPEVRCHGAFLSEATGIIDSHSYMQALQADIEADGGMVVLHTPVTELVPGPEGIRVVTGGNAPSELLARRVVNSAGHGAPGLARDTRGLRPEFVPKQWYAKGNYFSLSGRQPFSRLIYPMPEAAGLGVHATIDMNGRCRFGPDVEWVEREDDLQVDPARADAFYRAIRNYWPDLPDGALQPDYAGMRPKIHGPTMLAADFRIDGPVEHGINGLVNLFGIESPGLTASLALAEIVSGLLDA